MKRRRYELLADVLDYPGPRLAPAVYELVSLLSKDSPEAAAALSTFQTAFETAGIAQLQELYIQTFDFRADCSLYVGHYLFGETGRRGAFLAELSERYCERELMVGTEVPDHLTCLLRYLATLDAGEETSELIHGCLLPAISRIAAANAMARSPYRVVLEGLLILLRQSTISHVQLGEFAWTSSSSSHFPILP
jgi:nitrate reductase delta subunit